VVERSDTTGVLRKEIFDLEGGRNDTSATTFGGETFLVTWSVGIVSLNPRLQASTPSE